MEPMVTCAKPKMADVHVRKILLVIFAIVVLKDIMGQTVYRANVIQPVRCITFAMQILANACVIRHSMTNIVTAVKMAITVIQVVFIPIAIRKEPLKRFQINLAANACVPKVMVGHVVTNVCQHITIIPTV